MWLKELFSDKKRKSALERLHALDKKIPLVTLKEENQNFEWEKRELYSKLDNAPTEEVVAAIDELNSRVDRYIRIQQDGDYSSIIEHLARKNIGSEDEIVEILDPLDSQIVYKYVQARKNEGFGNVLKRHREKLASVEQIIGRTQGVVSEKDDAEELRRYWNYILQEEQDKLNGLKNRIGNLKTSELDAFENEISYLSERFNCLEKYVRDYLCEQSLEAYTGEVKECKPREDITYEDIFKGLGDSIAAELKDCTGVENMGKIIKESLAKLIYSRLKKGMFLR